ncbi:MAG TPA: hypothetical protein VN253_12775 [Kofleriaceae bacterium]|nr:hypothetical protein [Kofleriaceae bacterium]
MTTPGWLLLIALIAAACAEPASTGANRPAERTAMSQLPSCKTGADLARLDGERVQVVGTYRREMVARKQGEPPTRFLGHVVIELSGRTTDYDPSRWDGPAEVSLGMAPRPADEVAHFADQLVAVEGRLVLNPPPADPEAASERLPPTLFDLGAVTAAK